MPSGCRGMAERQGARAPEGQSHLGLSRLDLRDPLDEQTRRSDQEEAGRLALLFKALADPNRLRLLSIVKNAGGGEACVCDLTEPLDLTQPTVSHHLKILVDAGLLHREKRGTWAYYSLVTGALDDAAGILTKL